MEHTTHPQTTTGDPHSHLAHTPHNTHTIQRLHYTTTTLHKRPLLTTERLHHATTTLHKRPMPIIQRLHYNHTPRMILTYRHTKHDHTDTNIHLPPTNTPSTTTTLPQLRDYAVLDVKFIRRLATGTWVLFDYVEPGRVKHKQASLLPRSRSHLWINSRRW